MPVIPSSLAYTLMLVRLPGRALGDCSGQTSECWETSTWSSPEQFGCFIAYIVQGNLPMQVVRITRHEKLYGYGLQQEHTWQQRCALVTIRWLKPF